MTAPLDVCGACGQPGELVWIQFFGRPDGWRCRDVAICYDRDWPELAHDIAGLIGDSQ